jgi:hypothetical protein
MSQTRLRGSTQIMVGTITADRFVTGLNLATSQLADGAEFVKRGGTVAFTADQSVGGFKLTNLADATNAQDAVNLRTAQALVNGIAVKRARVVATGNLALTGVQTIDGVSGVAGDVVLLTGQTTASQNGPWVQASGAWARTSDWADASSQKSTIFFVEEGTTFHDTKWLTITDGITVGTTSVTINQDTSGTSYTNGSGLSLTGSTFAVKLSSTGGLSFDGSSNVQIALDGTNLSLSSSGLKIANGTAGQVLLAGASGVAAMTSISGDFTLSSAGVATAASAIMKTTNFIRNETPSGTINSSNTTFTLANTPVAGSEALYWNAVRMFPGAGNDYTISGGTITTLFTPDTGDRLAVDYLK